MFNPFVPNIPQVEHSILAKIAKKIGLIWVNQEVDFVFSRFKHFIDEHVNSTSWPINLAYYRPQGVTSKLAFSDSKLAFF